MLRHAAVSATSCIALVVLLAMPGERAGGGAPYEPQDSRSKFPHDLHVPNLWYDTSVPEVRRDCRGCHDFRNRVDPEQVCRKCHVDQEDTGAISLDVKGRVADIRRSGSAFDHLDHDRMDCRSCHLKPGGNGQADMRIPEGIGWCTSCHDPKAGTSAVVVSADSLRDRAVRRGAGFKSKMDESPATAGNPDAVFRHTDHILPADLDDPVRGRCDACHQNMRGAGAADFGERAFDTAACATCHGMQGHPVEVAVRREGLATRSLGTFRHADHMKPDSATRHPDDLGKGCLSCHSWDDSADVPTYKLDKAGDLASCYDCHYHREKHQWTPGPEAPAHGEVGTCTDCHVFDGAADAKTARPVVDVKRRRPAEFRITRQVHPHIMGEMKNEKCSTCHIANVPAARSRIGEAKFRHASHLSANPKSAECALCHEQDASGMMQLRGVDGWSLTYKADACTTCHEGVERIEPTRLLDDVRSAVRFPHGPHVAMKDGKPVQECSDCHVAGSAGDRDHGYAEGVLDCTACHDHDRTGDRAWFARTGNVDRDYVRGCVDCHTSVMPPKGGPPAAPIARVHFAALKGRQFHPLPEDRSCAECHTLAPAGFADILPPTVTAQRKGYTNPKQFHNAIWAYDTGKDCLRCHWNQLADPSKQASEEIGSRYRTLPKRKPLEIRRLIGNDLTTFPGPPK